MPDNRPHLIEKIDLNAPIDVLRRTLVAGTDALLRLRITRGPSPENTTGASIELHLSGDDDGTPWAQTCAGEAEDEAAGWWKIEIPAAKLNLVGAIDGQILLTDADAKESCSQLLRLKVVEKLTGGATPPPGSEINWSEYTGYANTATHGPVRPGTGITNTVNADGSNTHAVAYGNSAGTAAQGNDARLSDSRTPTAHASTHATGGTDAITPANIGALAVGGTAADVNPAGTAIAAALGAKANDNAVVKLTGNQTIAGTKTFSTAIAVSSGGTGGTTQSAARIGLGLGTIATQNVDAINTNLTSDLLDPKSLGSEGIPWLVGWFLTLRTGIARALGAGGIALQDSAGTTHATVASTGVALNQLTASRPLALDASKNVTSPTAADFRTSIEGQRTPVVNSGSITAVLDTVYHGTAAATYTDPTPADGRGFVVRVVNGTQTVGGIGYAVSGTLILRVYHSGAWLTRVLRSPSGTITESGTTRTIGRADVGQFVRLTNAGACTITVPANSTTAFEDGDTVYFRVTTVSPAALTLGSGVTVNNAAAITTLPQHSTFALRRTATTDVWDFV